MKKILIMGAGAIGSVAGGLLKKAGHDVTLLGRPLHIEAIRASGLKISGIWGNHDVSGLSLASHPSDTTGPFDVILITSKSYDTRQAAHEVVPFLSPDSLVVSFQNGLGNMEAIAYTVGADRTAGARVIYGAELEKPGQVRVTVYAEPVIVGPYRTSMPVPIRDTIQWLVASLDAAGIPSRYAEDVVPYLWAKVFYNAPLNPLSALIRATYGALAENPFTHSLMDCIIEEAFSVAKGKGVALPWTSYVDYLEVFYRKLIPPTASHYASMLRDLERRKRTEIDAINGMVCTYARDVGVRTPVNEALVTLFKFKESQRTHESQHHR